MLCGGSSLTFGWHRHGLQDDLLAKAGTVLANSGVLKFGKGGVHVIGKAVFTRQRLGAGAPVTKLSAQHWTNATFSCRSLTYQFNVHGSFGVIREIRSNHGLRSVSCRLADISE
jgi:hypothetical protein